MGSSTSSQRRAHHPPDTDGGCLDTLAPSLFGFEETVVTFESHRPETPSGVELSSPGVSGAEAFSGTLFAVITMHGAG